MKIWLTEASYKDPVEAQDAAITLVNTVPELKGFVIQYGSLLVIRNSTETKAREARNWIREYTKPVDVRIRREMRVVELGESLRRVQERAGRIGERLEGITRERARPIYETEGGIIGAMEEVWRKYKGGRRVY